MNSYHPVSGNATSTTYNANTGNVNRATYNTRTGETTDRTYNASNIKGPGDDDVYAGRDGQVYRQTASGGWQQFRNDGGWGDFNDADRISDFNQDRFARQWGGFRADGYQRSFGGGWGGGFRFGGRR